MFRQIICDYIPWLYRDVMTYQHSTSSQTIAMWGCHY